jgi:hypothetical protein
MQLLGTSKYNIFFISLNIQILYNLVNVIIKKSNKKPSHLSVSYDF